MNKRVVVLKHITKKGYYIIITATENLYSQRNCNTQRVQNKILFQHKNSVLNSRRSPRTINPSSLFFLSDIANLYKPDVCETTSVTFTGKYNLSFLNLHKNVQKEA